MHLHDEGPERRWRLQARRDPAPYDLTEEDGLIHDASAEAGSQEETGRVSSAERQPRVERELTPEEGEALERLLGQLRLPVVPELAMGLDGTTWRLRVEQGWNVLDLSWWPDLPASWGALRPLLHHFAALAELPPDFPERPA